MNNREYEVIIKRIERLEKMVFRKQMVINTDKQSEKTNTKINFSLNYRAYVSRYAAGKSGPKKFVLMVAYLAKGEIEKEISLSDIKNLWSKMETKKLLGKYNDFYPNEAKTKGWIDSYKHGFCHLTNEWEKIN